MSPDGISSSAYGTEEMLIELMPIFGLAAFAVLIPLTGVILFVMLLVVLSYREVVTVYTRAGAATWWPGRISGRGSRRSPQSRC